MTPARAHRLKFEAAQRAAQGEGAEYGGVLDQLREDLFKDKRTLKGIRSIREKETAKGHMLPKYQPYIDGVLERGTGASDDIFATLFIWALDAGELDQALTMAAYVLRHNLPSPDEHQRTNAEILTEDAIAKLTDESGQLAPEAGPFLERINALVTDKSMVDAVRAKLEKALGMVALTDNPSAAADHFRNALKLNPSSGCKRWLNDAQKRIKAGAP